MKYIYIAAAALAAAVAFTGCEKQEPTLADKVEQTAKAADKAAKDTAKAADKAAADVTKAADKAAKDAQKAAK